jgi:predicted ABC-type ATPase
LPDFVHCREFLNADLIAAGLAPFAPETQNLRAGRMLLERMSELVSQKIDFGFETTLSGRGYLQRLSDMKANGYRIVLFFLWLPSPRIAIARVVSRVRQGGHAVPMADVRRRYWAGLWNLFRLYRPLLDEWWLYDASKLPPTPIASEETGKVKLIKPRLYRRIETYRYGATLMAKVRKQSFSKLLEAAFAKVAATVIERARQSGTPIILWQGRDIKEVMPADIASRRKLPGRARQRRRPKKKHPHPETRHRTASG